jgi:hypothetical protein
VKNLSRTEEIDLAAKYNGGHLLARYMYRVSHNRFFLTLCAAASRQNGDYHKERGRRKTPLFLNAPGGAI